MIHSSSTFVPKSEWTWEKSVNRVASQSWSARKKPKKNIIMSYIFIQKKKHFFSLLLSSKLCAFFRSSSAAAYLVSRWGGMNWAHWECDSESTGERLQQRAEEQAMKTKMKKVIELSFLELSNISSFWLCLNIVRLVQCSTPSRTNRSILGKSPTFVTQFHLWLMEWKLFFFRVFVDFQSNTHRTNWPSDQRWHKCDTTFSNISIFLCVIFFSDAPRIA